MVEVVDVEVLVEVVLSGVSSFDDEFEWECLLG
jgi:hypothetical protein